MCIFLILYAFILLLKDNSEAQRQEMTKSYSTCLPGYVGYALKLHNSNS